jgi:ring-1,2-phenylacetyl-CoA epoxidase subunit PaaD
MLAAGNMSEKKLNIPKDEVWDALKNVTDPEIPVLSLVDMKIVRDVRIDGDEVHVTMTPTFAGCPAIYQMKSDIEEKLRELGFEKINVELSFKQPWSTEMLGEEARAKLESFGITPPSKHDGDPTKTMQETVKCPFCKSVDTTMENPFGPTLCRMIYYCNSCQQPFERFKAL